MDHKKVTEDKTVTKGIISILKKSITMSIMNLALMGSSLIVALKTMELLISAALLKVGLIISILIYIRIRKDIIKFNAINQSLRVVDEEDEEEQLIRQQTMHVSGKVHTIIELIIMAIGTSLYFLGWILINIK